MKIQSKQIEKLFIYIFLFSLIIPISKPVFSGLWTRIYLFDFFLFPVLVFWVHRLWRERDMQWSIAIFDVLMILLLFWLFVSNVTGDRSARSLEYWLIFLRCFLIYLYFTKNLGKTVSFKGLLVTLSVILFLEAGLAVFQQITNSNIGQVNNYIGVKDRVVGLCEANNIRAVGTFINPNILAGWMVALIPVVISWGIYIRSNVHRLLLVAVFFTGMAGVFASLSRTKLALSFIGVGILLFLHRSLLFQMFKKRKAVVFTLCMLTALVGLVVYSGMGEQTIYRFERLFTKGVSFERKAAQRDLAFDMMRSNPLLGVGQGNFGINVEKEDYPFRNYRKELTCHNIPLKIGAESGILGFVLFLSLFAYLLVFLAKRIKAPPAGIEEAVADGALIAAFLAFLDMQWNTVFTHYSFMPLFFVIISIPVSVYKEDLYKFTLKKERI